MVLDSEYSYVGVSCGKMNQSCEVYLKQERLFCLHARDGSYELIPQYSDMNVTESRFSFRELSVLWWSLRLI